MIVSIVAGAIVGAFVALAGRTAFAKRVGPDSNEVRARVFKDAATGRYYKYETVVVAGL